MIRPQTCLRTDEVMWTAKCQIMDITLPNVVYTWWAYFVAETTFLEGTVDMLRGILWGWDG